LEIVGSSSIVVHLTSREGDGLHATIEHFTDGALDEYFNIGWLLWHRLVLSSETVS